MDASLPPQLPSLSELESRMQIMRVSVLEEHQTNETFSQRCSSLLSLCQDLYNGYATLLHRFNHSNPEIDSDTDISSEVESILSFQQTQKHNIGTDELQTKLQEASKTIELLKKFVMLIDMEKEVAVEETTNLGYKLTSLLEENRELAIEALFMKKEAVRLARYMLKMRDEHFHKVVLLQNQIYELKSSRGSFYENVSSPSCFGLDNSKKRKMSETRSELGEKKRSKWLKRLNPFTKCSIIPSFRTLN